MDRYKRVLLFAAVFICAAVCFAYYYKTYLMVIEADESLLAGVKELPAYAEVITVDVAGEVKNPGLYTLPLGSRVNDAVEMAGGMTHKADRDRADSLAMKLKDGQKIYVPNTEDDIDKLKFIKDNNDTGGLYSSKDPNVLVNINTAEAEELMMLQGVGETTAETIIQYRELYGGFKSTEEIKNVKGIGEKTFEEFKNNITID